MKIGVFSLALGMAKGTALSKAFASHAERLGFSTLWVPEHVVLLDKYASRYPYTDNGVLPAPTNAPIPDPFLSLAVMASATEKIRLALGSHLRVVADQLDVATVFIQEWRYLEGERREEILDERRRYEERIRGLFREGRELGELRSDLDDATAALLALSASNWAYTWLRPGADTDELADRFYDLLIDGMRGYATP